MVSQKFIRKTSIAILLMLMLNLLPLDILVPYFLSKAFAADETAKVDLDYSEYGTLAQKGWQGFYSASNSLDPSS